MLGQSRSRECKKCLINKAASEFGKLSKVKSGLNPWCRACHNERAGKMRRAWDLKYPGKRRNKYDRWSTRFPERKKDIMLRSKYGISLVDYNVRLKRQRGTCAICCEAETVRDRNGNVRPLSVDHCHKTKEVRGLLCTKCNSGLGYFKDRPGLMQKALTYVFVGGFDGLAEALHAG